MAQKINILPEQLCNQIAAGEVVERPSSVIKELVENSLDAGATEVRIDVEVGGKKLIRVVDDGHGMSRDDAFLCLERHATSKIAASDDLFRINTLGFRGEALPSISAVSRMTICTRSEESDEGWEIYLEGGVVKRADAVGAPIGTAIEIRDLFFNTPARKKFMRRTETELGHVADIVSKMALAYPAVQFSLNHNGRSLLDVYREKGLKERVGAVLGRPLVKDLLEIDVQGPDGLHLRGLIAQPAVNRSTAGAIYTYINGRYIRDRVVQHALLEGYRNLVPKGRYPVLVLFIDIDPGLVDVNVHPTKHEVRFREQSVVHDFIAASIRDALRPSDWLSSQHVPPPEPSKPITHPQTVHPASASSIAERQAPLPGVDRSSGDSASAIAENRQHGVREALDRYSQKLDRQPCRTQSILRGRPQTPFVVPETAVEEKGFFASLNVLGQYHRSYILCEDGDDLVLIDQHAAHERIGFERLKAQFLKERVAQQTLLFPEMMEFDFKEADALEKSLEDLLKLGFTIEPFGGKTFALKAIPQLINQSIAGRLVRDLTSELVKYGKSGLIEEALDDVLILMACHGMVRANQTLTMPEISSLLRDLDTVDFNAHCPHGRPVMKRLSLGDVEKMFKRT